MEEASNGRTSKGKKAVEQEPKNKVNKSNDIEGTQYLTGEWTKKKTTKAKASNAQSSKGEEVEEDNGDLKRTIQDLEDKIRAQNVKIKDNQTRIGKVTMEKDNVEEDITEQKNKETETGRKIDRLDLRKGKLVEKIGNLDLQKEEVVKEKTKLGKGITELKRKEKYTGTQIADLKKKENTLVEEKGALAKELDEKKTMRIDNLEKRNEELAKDNGELKKDNEKLVRKERKTREEKRELKNSYDTLQDKYDGRCCSSCSIC
ncbi:hypothetical protein TRIUR3_27624 [Triticum urartu]|uniref:Uncharacterized protein n=1 Tax=Triticum urartu TaxID=4572 RepID=M8AHN9_TRIUA|nr:M-phase phosphoprotein 8-like [Triticum urartu]EMS64440.1 hypothetical protein TRIUR3_27624 [Triticum urartu]